LKGEGLRAAARVAPTAKTDQERWLGKARRSSESTVVKIFVYPGPVGRIELRKATQILRAGNIAKPDRYASPVMGSGERRL